MVAQHAVLAHSAPAAVATAPNNFSEVDLPADAAALPVAADEAAQHAVAGLGAAALRVVDDLRDLHLFAAGLPSAADLHDHHHSEAAAPAPSSCRPAACVSPAPAFLHSKVC